MSTAQDLPPTPTRQESVPAQQGSGPNRPGRLSRVPGGSRTVAVAAAVLVVAGGGTAFALGRTAATVTPDTPITLPDTIQGLPALTSSDLLRTSEWRAKAEQATGGNAFDAATYGKPGATLTMRVVAARSDLTGQLDTAWAVDKGTKVGAVSCTQNIQPVKNGRSGVRPTVMLCWRTSDTLSVYALTIDPKNPITSNASTATAVGDAWKAAGGN